MNGHAGRRCKTAVRSPAQFSTRITPGAHIAKRKEESDEEGTVVVDRNCIVLRVVFP